MSARGVRTCIATGKQIRGGADINNLKTESELLYDWLFTANKFVLALSLEPHDQFFFLAYFPYFEK
jgi:hypothetical protein